MSHFEDALSSQSLGWKERLRFSMFADTARVTNVRIIIIIIIGVVVSDTSIYVLKRDVKLQLTLELNTIHFSSIKCFKASLPSCDLNR